MTRRRRTQLPKRLQAKADRLIAKLAREQRELPDVTAINACWPSVFAGALSYLLAEIDPATERESHRATAMRLLAIAADRIGPAARDAVNHRAEVDSRDGGALTAT